MVVLHRGPHRDDLTKHTRVHEGHHQITVRGTPLARLGVLRGAVGEGRLGDAVFI